MHMREEKKMDKRGKNTVNDLGEREVFPETARRSDVKRFSCNGKGETILSLYSCMYIDV